MKLKKIFIFFNIKNLILLILIPLTILIIYTSYFRYKDQVLEQFELNKDKFFFEPKDKTKQDLIILGNKFIDKKSLVYEINKTLNLDKNKSNLLQISNLLKKKKLIRRFIITKKSSNSIEIQIQEKNIIGLFKIKTNSYLIDEFNDLIKIKITPNLFYLPIFIGKNSYKHANVILKLIKKSNVNLNFKSFSLINERRWNLNLNNGVKILLPENKILDTFKLLKKIDSQYDILKGNFIEIDLRINGKIFLKPKIN